MSEVVSSGTTYESKTEAEQELGVATFVRMWLDAISQASTEEDDWRKRAEKAIKIYRGKDGGGRKFNILHSNVETLCPALYNSTPAPDVRRRFADNDPVGRVASDILERALEFSIDNYDFDSTIKSVIKDGELAGRGVPRVRYVPTFGDPIKDEAGEPVVDGDGEPVKEMTYEEVVCDYVPWRYFRRGPGRTWADIPWVAFGDFLSKEAIVQLNPAIAKEIPLNFSADATGDLKKVGSEEPSIFKRAFVWQIWDKESRKVITVCPDFASDVLSVMDDPLKLSGFFPVPRPYQPIHTTDALVPIVPFDIYEDLVLELNEITARISRLVKQLRPRGGYGGNVDDIKLISEASDGELVPLGSVELLSSGKGISDFITWFPLEPTVAALQQLVGQREQVKATIFEVTGLSDIIRGASNASETATAQNIKQQWGSLRIQDRQQEVQRLVRDLFRIKSEIIATKFSWDTLSQMTGIQLPTQAAKVQAQQLIQQAQQQAAMAAQQQPQQAPPQAGQPPQGQPGQPAQPPQPPAIPDDIQKMLAQPSVEDVMKLLQNDMARVYRIDVESDSTIRGDLTRNQQQMNSFLDGTAKFAQAMGPILQTYPAMMKPAMEVYTAFTRQFRLGKQAEDALDTLSDAASSGSMSAQQKTDPKHETAQLKAQAEGARTQGTLQETQMKGQISQQEFQQESALMDKKMEIEERKLALTEQKLAAKERQQALKDQQQARQLLQPALDPIQLAAMEGSVPQQVQPNPNLGQ